MKERLVQLLEREQLSPSRFADIIGVQRSNVSHIVSGRNNPSYDFLQKTLDAFPGLQAEWLLMGKGKMFDGEGTGSSETGSSGTGSSGTGGSGTGSSVTGGSLTDASGTGGSSRSGFSGSGFSGTLFDQVVSQTPGMERGKRTGPVSEAGPQETTNQVVGEKPVVNRQNNKGVIQVVILYSDGTFRIFDPSDAG